MDRERWVRVVAALAVLAGTASLVVLAVGGQGGFGGAFSRGVTIYGRSHVALAFALVLAGLLLMASRSRGGDPTLLAVIVLVAGLLAGAGVVGNRRWPLYRGCCSTKSVNDEELLRLLAIGMGVGCALVAGASLVTLVLGRHLTANVLSIAVAVPVTALLAVYVPRLAYGDWQDHRELAAWALMYSLPLSAALLVAAALPRVPAISTVAVVAGVAVVTLVGEPFIFLQDPDGDETKARVAVLVACLLVGATASRGSTRPRHLPDWEPSRTVR